MAKYSLGLKLLFLRKYRTSKKIYRQLRYPLNSSTQRSSYKPGIPSEVQVPPNFVGEQTPPLQVPGGTRWTTGAHRRIRRPRNLPVEQVDCCLLICDCLQQNKLRTFLFLLGACIVTSTGLYYHHQKVLHYTIYREDVFSPKHGIRLKRCTLPNLQPFSSEIIPFVFYNSVAPNCPHEQKDSLMDEPPFFIQNGSLLTKNPSIGAELGPESTCCFRPFHRRDEGQIITGRRCHPISGEVTQVPPAVEYIELFCHDQITNVEFRDGFSLVPEKPHVEERIREFEEIAKPKKNRNRLSISILGLDATSHMNFLRAMPKSSKYLLKKMSAISLKGYTKVAENTLPNVIPFLTGLTLEQFKKECVDEVSNGPNYVHLDECPFIWKHFAKNGYRTGFSEDDPDISIFNMNWANAFIMPPTDYYLRPFSVRMHKEQNYKHGYCYGASLSFEKLLENMREMAETFEGGNRAYFQFTWSTKLSHDDFNKMRWGDEPLLKWLEHLNTNNLLNNTVLIVVGDHGSRLDNIRGTNQGKLEDRMPVAYIVMPPWFRKKYPEYYGNLERNSKLITSAFDMHKTLYSLMNLDSLGEEDEYWLGLANNESVPIGKYKGTSLLREIPENRTCFEAGIPLHWCVCHRKIPVDLEEEFVEDAGEHVVQSLNILLRGQKLCASLSMKSIDEVSKWDSKEIEREGCNLKKNETKILFDVDDDNSDWCDNTKEILVLQIAFTVSPSDAKFETTVIQLQNGGWHLTEEVVRTNAYEGQSNCVEQKYKPYCYCEDEGFFSGW
ncbi:unnamed protein product [Orchesella dallaii]|uniref:Uncharacterized protein n=1 Tax=Orchesella dallaii TaxID=48710 RepID=A0ABP1R704_9HEXA